MRGRATILGSALGRFYVVCAVLGGARGGGFVVFRRSAETTELNIEEFPLT